MKPSPKIAHGQGDAGPAAGSLSPTPALVGREPAAILEEDLTFVRSVGRALSFSKPFFLQFGTGGPLLLQSRWRKIPGATWTQKMVPPEDEAESDVCAHLRGAPAIRGPQLPLREAEMPCEQPELPAPGSTEARSSLTVLVPRQKAAKPDFSRWDLPGEVCPPCCVTLTVDL